MRLAVGHVGINFHAKAQDDCHRGNPFHGLNLRDPNRLYKNHSTTQVCNLSSDDANCALHKPGRGRSGSFFTPADPVPKIQVSNMLDAFRRRPLRFFPAPPKVATLRSAGAAAASRVGQRVGRDWIIASALRLLPGAIFGCLASATAMSASQTSAAEPGYRIYVTNEGSGDVTVIDGRSHVVLAKWPLGKRPRGITASSDGQFLYVALSGSPIAGPGVDEHSLPPPDKDADGIGVVRVSDGKLLQMLHGVSDPEQIAVNGDGSRLYVASEDTGNVIVLDIKSGRTLAHIEVGEEPEGIAVRPDGQQIWVTSEVRNTVSVIDATNFRLIGQIGVGGRPREVAFAPDGSRAYATGETDGSIVAIDAVTRTIVNKAKVPGDHPRPKGAVVSRDGKRVYVTTGREGRLVALNAETLSPIGSVAVGARPWGVALSPDGRLIYTANGPSNNVAIVDAEAMTVMTNIDVGTRPWGLVVVPEESH